MFVLSVLKAYFLKRYQMYPTVCPKSLASVKIVISYIKCVKTSWTDINILDSINSYSMFGRITVCPKSSDPFYIERHTLILPNIE